jgi:hypothetical protein
VLNHGPARQRLPLFWYLAAGTGSASGSNDDGGSGHCALLALSLEQRFLRDNAAAKPEKVAHNLCDARMSHKFAALRRCINRMACLIAKRQSKETHRVGPDG